MARVLSAIKPTGEVHLGNYLGALRGWVAEQHTNDAFHPVADLHALTAPQDPAELATATRHVVQMLVAVGLEPEICTLFVQSHVHEHAELSWLMECTASMGELRRMTQFKEKTETSESVSAGLFTYPALMAADILLYDADKVPVGDDQRQHLELTRDLAERFNNRYGETFVVPEAAVPQVAARVMDLQAPTSKMSKSEESPQGTIALLDDPAAIERKIRRAVTDPGTDVAFDPADKPGVSNLLSILAATTGRSPDDVAEGYSAYGPLKADTIEAVVETLRPIQDRYAELDADHTQAATILEAGAAKATQVASATLARAQRAVGLLSR